MDEVRNAPLHQARILWPQYQYQHSHVGHCALLARSLQELWRLVRRAPYFGNVWRLYHCGVSYRQFHVLHPERTNFASGLLVWVLPCVNWLVCCFFYWYQFMGSLDEWHWLVIAVDAIWTGAHPIISPNHLWLHQLWLSSHSHCGIRTLAMVCGSFLLTICVNTQFLFRLMIITGTLTLITAVAYWCVIAEMLGFLRYSDWLSGSFFRTRLPTLGSWLLKNAL